MSAVRNRMNSLKVNSYVNLRGGINVKRVLLLRIEGSRPTRWIVSPVLVDNNRPKCRFLPE